MLIYRRFIYCALLVLFLPYSYKIYFYPSKATLNSNSLEGKQIFQNFNCIACHQIYGLGGYIGPDITNVHSKKGANYIKFILSNGLNKMPKLNLNNDEINNLVEYLKAVDQTGTSPYVNAKINFDGTISK